jgi:autotransporter-associated beta strand protein
MKPRRHPRLRAFVLALAAAASAHAHARLSLDDPAVAQAYEGPATFEKLSAAMAGLRPLLAELRLITYGGHGGYISAGFFPRAEGGIGLSRGTISFPFFSLVSPQTELWAGSDADLGPAGEPFVMANTRLILTAGFSTGREFIIGHPSYGPDYIPLRTLSYSLIALDEDGLPIPYTPPPPPPAGGPGWIDTAGHELIISGRLTSWQRLYKEGAGTLWLTGDNVWHAKPRVEAGVLKGDSTSLRTDIVNHATVSFAQVADGDYAHVISGRGGLEKAGAGVLSLLTSQPYTGPTRIEQGTLALVGGGIDASSAVQVAAAGMLDASALPTTTLNNLAGEGRVRLGAEALKLVNTVDNHYSGRIEGQGALLVTGRGWLTLTGDNGQLGGTRVVGGRLAFAADRALGAAGAPLALAQDAHLQLLDAVELQRPLVIAGSGGNVDIRQHRLDLRAPLQGDGLSLTKTGTGSLALHAAATFTGELNVKEGSLELIGAGSLPEARLYLHGGTRLDLAAADGDRALRGIRGYGDIELGDNTLLLTDYTTHHYGRINGTGGLTITGGLHYLYGHNTYTGPTTLLAGSLKARPYSLSDRIINHAELTIEPPGGWDSISAYSGDISGSGRMIKSGEGVLWLRGHNSFSGGGVVERGVLMGNTHSLPGNYIVQDKLAFYQVADGVYGGQLSGEGTLLSFGPGALTLSGENLHRGGTAFSNTLRIARDANLGAASGGLLIVGGTLVALDDLTLPRHVALGEAGGRFDSNGRVIRLSGRLDGPGGLTKLGEGVLHLNGWNAYAGGTRVEQGGLVVNGHLPGNAEVLAGAWMQFMGGLGGNLHIAEGGRLEPGNSPGTLLVGGDLLASGELHFEFAGPDLYDRILIGGRADLSGATLSFALLGDYRPEDLARHVFLQANGGITGLDRVSYRFGPGLEGYRVAFNGNGLHLAPVPEPQTWAMLLAGLGLMGHALRRRAAGAR